MEIVSNKVLEGERAAFWAKDTRFEGCTFRNGESPLKESRGVEVHECVFDWKYPMWYSHGVKVDRSTLNETARSGIWYTHDIEIVDSLIEAPKTFRRAGNVTLKRVKMPNAKETFWNCDGVRLEDVEAAGDYFGFGSHHIEVHNLHLDGNYCFDGASDVKVYDSVLNSKDSFWNCQNVEVYDSVIVGEYIGWNTRNMTLVNCTIESLQGLCYIQHLKLVNCHLKGTSLSFEYCEDIDAQVDEVDSVFNPSSGVIKARRIGELTMDPTKIDPAKTQIIVEE